MKFYLLNVFTKNGQNGNQLAAIIGRKNLSAKDMQKIAAEFNFSESIFIDPDDPEKIRIFTPRVEYPFAGHPTVGGGWLLNHLGIRKDKFSIHVPLGEVKIQSGLTTYITFPGSPVVIEENGVIKVDAGPVFTMFPMKTHEDLKNAQLPHGNTERQYLFYKHDDEHYSVRMFGVKEDAATGSAACALAAYLRKIKGIPDGSITISQGIEINRECELKLSWNTNQIQVGGAVTLWGEGNLLL